MAMKSWNLGNSETDNTDREKRVTVNKRERGRSKKKGHR